MELQLNIGDSLGLNPAWFIISPVKARSFLWKTWRFHSILVSQKNFPLTKSRETER